MYYKDNYLEIRLGLGIKDFNSVNNEIVTITLIKLDSDNTETIIEEFTTETGLSKYPIDGTYKLKIDVSNVSDYFVYVSVSDSFIKEFIEQVKNVTCNCGCTSDDNGCDDGKNCDLALKRQKVFNLESILPYTIKPFHYGQAAPTNPNLFFYLQAYYNEALIEKKVKLSKEYFKYSTTGTTVINVELFNEIIAMNYYAVYFYSRFNLLTNATTLLNEYIKIIDDFFKIKLIGDCLQESNIKGDLEAIVNAETPIASKVYYWQLELGQTIDNVMSLISPSYLNTKASSNLDLFYEGSIIPLISIGKLVIAVPNVPIDDFYLEDSLGNNVTQAFDLAYDTNNNIQVFVSKLVYSVSNIYFKFKKL